MLAREVLRLRGTIINREAPWDVMVDLYFCTYICAIVTLNCILITVLNRPRP